MLSAIGRDTKGSLGAIAAASTMTASLRRTGRPSREIAARHRRRPSSSSPSSSYYDSQSATRVPVHDVREISILLDATMSRRRDDGTDGDAPSFVVPAHLYKGDPSSADVPERLAGLRSAGVRGILLPPLSFPRDVRNLRTLRDVSPSEDFLLFAAANDATSASPALRHSENVSMILNFDAERPANWMGAKELQRINGEVGTRVSTTISLSNVGKEEQNPITIANQVASWIDATQGGDFIWVPSSSGNLEALERLCGELAYLDLVGKTVASRLIIGGGGGGGSSAVCEDLVEETMFSGVNKFAVSKEEDISLIAEIAESQGKSIIGR